jgi:hypothetical protein
MLDKCVAYNLNYVFFVHQEGVGLRPIHAGIVGSNPTGAWIFVSCECLCCQVEVSATGRSLIKRSPTDCGVCLSVIKCK